MSPMLALMHPAPIITVYTPYDRDASPPYVLQKRDNNQHIYAQDIANIPITASEQVTPSSMDGTRDPTSAPESIPPTHSDRSEYLSLLHALPSLRFG